MSQDERFWKWISNLYKILMVTSAFTTITSPLTSNPIGPIVGIVIFSGCYFVYRHFKRIKKITGILSKRARVILVLILVIFVSIGTYGFLRLVIPPNITVNDPQGGDVVPWKHSVKGSSSWEVFASRIWPEGLGLHLHVYVLIFPVESNGPWWVQDPAIVRPNGDWEVYAYFGRDPAEYPDDIGDPFRVCAIITKDKLQPEQSFQDFPDYISVSEIYQVIRSG